MAIVAAQAAVPAAQAVYGGVKGFWDSTTGKVVVGVSLAGLVGAGIYVAYRFRTSIFGKLLGGDFSGIFGGIGNSIKGAFGGIGETFKGISPTLPTEIKTPSTSTAPATQTSIFPTDPLGIGLAVATGGMSIVIPTIGGFFSANPEGS